MSTWSNIFKKGDRVLFLGTPYPVYDREGNEVYAELESGEYYTVKDSYILSIKLEEFDGIYLKEFFRKT